MIQSLPDVSMCAKNKISFQGKSDRILTAGDMLVAIFSVNMWRSIKAYLDPFILSLELSMFARRSHATLLFMNKQTMAGTNRCKITWFT